MTNPGLFRAKLSTQPLAHHFLEFDGGADAEIEQEYLKALFVKANVGKRSLFLRVVEATAMSEIRGLFKTISNTIYMVQ